MSFHSIELVPGYTYRIWCTALPETRSGVEKSQSIRVGSGWFDKPSLSDLDNPTWVWLLPPRSISVSKGVVVQLTLSNISSPSFLNSIATTQPLPQPSPMGYGLKTQYFGNCSPNHDSGFSDRSPPGKVDQEHAISQQEKTQPPIRSLRLNTAEFDMNLLEKCLFETPWVQVPDASLFPSNWDEMNRFTPQNHQAWSSRCAQWEGGASAALANYLEHIRFIITSLKEIDCFERLAILQKSVKFFSKGVEAIQTKYWDELLIWTGTTAELHKLFNAGTFQFDHRIFWGAVDALGFRTTLLL